VHAALNRATALREQAKAAGVGSAPLFAQAREQAQRALALVQSGPADAALLEQVEQLQAELDAEERDRTLLAALEAAHLAQAETLARENRFVMERAIPLFREALRAYGLPIGEGEPAAVAARLRGRPVAVQQAVIASLDEWDALAGDAWRGITEPHREWLRAVLDAAEPDDGWGRQVRAARREGDAARRQAALEALAAAADVPRLPALALTRLAAKLPPAPAVALLRRAQGQYPADFWVTHDLGIALQQLTPPEWAEAVRYLTAATALRPDSPGVHLNLGDTLRAQGRVDEAIACFRRALDLDPKYLRAHTSLGGVLAEKGRVDEAIACFRRALDLDPKFVPAHNNLGVALQAKGQADEAIACYRRALDLDPKYAQAHTNLGNALADKGQADEAIACYRRALDLDPKHAPAHYNLGYALRGKGQVDEAIACYRRALALNPKYAQAHGSLGAALLYTGCYAEARDALAQALQLYPKKDPRRAVNAGRVQVCERLLKLEARLPRLLRGEDQPGSAQENLDLATICQHRRLYAAAARCFAAAFAADPKLADDRGPTHRYYAACAAALAAAGQGKGDLPSDEAARARLRAQALEWLKAELAAGAKQLDSHPEARPVVVRRLQHWKVDSNLAGVRDPGALEARPEPERNAWRALWAEVDRRLQPERKQP
jgi:tetratricopeptide (TPR) repeat protein